VKVLVTGSAGLLGHDVWKLFERKHDLVALGRTQAPWVGAERFRTCDLTNAAHTYALVTKENPEVIVHCAAYNNVDAAETHAEDAYRGNALATRNLLNDLRGSGEITGGPKPFAPRDRSEFLSALDRAIVRIKRQSTPR